MNTTRNNIVKELYETEETYINSLEILVNHFLKDMKEKKLLTKFHDIFAQVDVNFNHSAILEFHIET